MLGPIPAFFSFGCITQIDIAVPITQTWPLALTSEAKFEVRTPRAFKVRFTKVGVDTYVQVSEVKVLFVLKLPPSCSP